MSFIDDIKILTQQEKLKKEKSTLGLPKTILIVEDEKPLATILGDRLLSEGFHVVKATNGKEGLEAVISHKPDVILLDLLMPVMDGKIMLRRLRAIPAFRHLPVIVLTNAGEVENIRETKTFNNAVEFLIKSNVTMDEIVEKIKTVT